MSDEAKMRPNNHHIPLKFKVYKVVNGRYDVECRHSLSDIKRGDLKGYETEFDGF